MFPTSHENYALFPQILDNQKNNCFYLKQFRCKENKYSSDCKQQQTSSNKNFDIKYV